MKIAQIAPIIERVPPKKYGGTERVIYALTEELVAMGHDVTIFATGDSITSGKLVSVYPKSIREAKIPDMYGANEYTVLNIASAYMRQQEFDVIHDHTGYLGLPAAAVATTPVVHTLHGAINTTNRKMFEQINTVHYVAISKAQVKPVPQLPIAGVVYNGLQMQDYPFSDSHDGYLLFVGRISAEKGTHYAIEVAKYLGMPLIIAAKLENIKPDLQYFKEYVEPLLDGDQIKWVGEVDEAERNHLMSRAKCFLHPCTWREPFGLTIIEAMACGCPVVAFSRGSMREIITQGRTGFVVEDADEMVEAVANIDVISRRDCRDHALKDFNANRMAQGYVNVYHKVIAARERALVDKFAVKTKRGVPVNGKTRIAVQ